MAVELPVDQPFDLERTLRCVQGYHGWRKDNKSPGWYKSVFSMGDTCPSPTGGSKHELVWIRQINGVTGLVEFETTGKQSQVADKLREQFRLDDDITDIYRQFRSTGDTMNQLVTAYHGLRVIHVDWWECLVFFALATITTIKQVQDDMDKLAKNSGVLVCSHGEEHYMLPNAAVLAKADESTLRDVSGRLTKLKPLAKDVSRRGINPDALAKMDYDHAIKELDALYFVGDKSANCVSLFSLGMMNSFPVDRHVRQSLKDLYSGTGNFPIDGDDLELREWAQKTFDPCAGYASQFLFIHDYDS